MASSGKRLNELDARAVEGAARAVDGVAFAELRRVDDTDVLGLVVWYDADPQECAARVQIMLAERFGVALGEAELRVNGIAGPRSGDIPDSDMKVIDLGETTWATAESELAHAAVPVTGDLPGPAAPSVAQDIDVESVAVERSRTSLSVRVVLIVGGSPAHGTASAGANDAGLRRAVAEATLRAFEGSSGIRYELESASLVSTPDRCALVVVSRGDDRRAGAAVAADDPIPALIRATLSAVAALGER